MAWRLREEDKHFLLVLVYMTGVIIFWRGLWGIFDIIPFIRNPFLSFAIGLTILTLTGWIYHEFNPFIHVRERLSRILNDTVSEIQHGKKYIIHYYDELAKKHIPIQGKKIRRLEAHHLVVEHKGKEHFVPTRRVSLIKHQGKVIWKR